MTEVANFSDRVARIERARKKHDGQVLLHVGEQAGWVKGKAKHGKAPKARASRSGFNPFAFVAAALVGITGAVLGIAAKNWLYFAPPAADAPAAAMGGMDDMQLVIGMGLGLAFSVALAQVLGLRARAQLPALALGVLLAVSTVHNLAFWLPPSVSTALFSDDWVNMEQASAEPDTLVFRSFKLTF